MNLSMRHSGQARLEKIPKVLEVLTALLVCVDMDLQVRTYTNGTLYTLLGRSGLRQAAADVDLERILGKVAASTGVAADPVLGRQIECLVEQLQAEDAVHLPNGGTTTNTAAGVPPDNGMVEDHAGVAGAVPPNNGGALTGERSGGATLVVTTRTSSSAQNNGEENPVTETTTNLADHGHRVEMGDDADEDDNFDAECFLAEEELSAWVIPPDEIDARRPYDLLFRERESFELSSEELYAERELEYQRFLDEMEAEIRHEKAKHRNGGSGNGGAVNAGNGDGYG